MNEIEKAERAKLQIECEYCQNKQNRHTEEIVVTFKYKNPEAYGYPEIVYWSDSYSMKYCPICGRKLVN